MKKSVVALAVAIIYTFTLCLPVFAFFEIPTTGQINYSAEYTFDGTANQKMQAGHLCNTGAEMKQVIRGDGSMTKTIDLMIIRGYLEVNDANDWVTSPDALRNLEVITVIELCAPPKSLFTEDGAAFASVVAMLTGIIHYLLNDVDLDDDMDDILDNLLVMVFQLPKYYDEQPSPPVWSYTSKLFPLNLPGWLVDEISIIIDELEDALENGVIVDPVDVYMVGILVSTLKVIIGESDILDPLNRQIWAVSVSADPGETGTLNQEFKAAEGPWGGVSLPIGGELGAVAGGFLEDFQDEINAVLSEIGLIGFALGEDELYLFGKPGDYNFWFDLLDYPYIEAKVGAEYVGSFFTIEQYAGTSKGVTKRFIELSSPWSHGYFSEDMVVTGMASVEESFSMKNLPAGKDIAGTWWKLF